MSCHSVQLGRWLTYAGKAGQPGGKGWIRLSPTGFKKARKYTRSSRQLEVRNAAEQ